MNHELAAYESSWTKLSSFAASVMPKVTSVSFLKKHSTALSFYLENRSLGQNKIVKDGENLKHPRLKSFFEWVFLTGAAILLVRLTIGGLAHFGVVDWGVEFLGGWLPSLIPLMLMMGGAIAVEELGKIKQK